MRIRGLTGAGLFLACLVFASPATAGHFLLDHPSPQFAPSAPLSSAVNSGGTGARWELVATIPTGNPHTDLDFFTRGGDTYASVGTLAIGPNAGGQTIVKLTDGNRVDPVFVASHPSASCLSNPAAATGLQHDVEATPKGAAILNTPNEFAVRSQTQLLVDATDAEGRCHDQGMLGLQNAPQGGLEIIDVTDPANPVEIGLISHIGEAHTVNIDPKRPHIAYAVTSDAIGVDDQGKRQNEVPGSADRLDLDGFEVVDLRSCMNFPPGTTVDAKRTACRPQVYRYRYPSAEMALGHTLKTGTQAIYACHELEVYPDDRLMCGSGNALIGLDMSGAFDDAGTPQDYSDDVPVGTPLPCGVRTSSSTTPYETGAMVTDCVNGTGPLGSEQLSVPNWLAAGAPSLQGVTYLGSIHHQGRGAGGAATPAYDSTKDIDFNHEAELTASRRFLVATDERGGGILPPGASCSPGADNVRGNGGVHFYDTGGLDGGGPGTPQAEQAKYAETPSGDRAIFRVPIRTQPRGTVCTAHVFHQMPGENRIFMAWYSQGTQVLDFVENPDGTVRFQSAGWFIPENANEWVSAIFKRQRNADGSTTYWGAAGDFSLGEAGRNAIDVYKVTFPPAPVASAPGEAPRTGPCAQRQGGTPGPDRLYGSIAGDRIAARAGRDRVFGRSGDDCLLGNRGRDRVSGGAGRDVLKGGRTRDRLRGGNGRDRIIDRAKGRDLLVGGNGRDRLRADGGGGDLVRCGPGRDRAVVDRRDQTRGCERVAVRR